MTWDCEDRTSERRRERRSKPMRIECQGGGIIFCDWAVDSWKGRQSLCVCACLSVRNWFVPRSCGTVLPVRMSNSQEKETTGMVLYLRRYDVQHAVWYILHLQFVTFCTYEYDTLDTVSMYS
jgi:hypothetical protein